MTRISLLATAMAFPARIAASAGANPAVANNGDEHHVGLKHGGELNESFRSAVTGRARGKLTAYGIQLRRIVKGDGAGLEFIGLLQKGFRGNVLPRGQSPPCDPECRGRL